MHTCIVSQRENEFHPVETRMNSMQNDAMTILCEDTGDPAAGRKMLTFIDERLNPEVSNG